MENNLFENAIQTTISENDFFNVIGELPTNGVQPEMTENNEVFEKAETEPETEFLTTEKESVKDAKEAIYKTGAKIGVEIIDILAPALVVIVYKLAFKAKININSLKASSNEKKVLTEVTEALLFELKIDLDNPYVNFAAVLFSVYGMKAMTAEPIPAQSEKRANSALKTENRGRHKKDCQCEKCLTKKQNV